MNVKEAKTKQGYVQKAIPQTCGNCANFKSDYLDVNEKYHKGKPDSIVRPFFEHRNMRCGIGGFAVKKMGTCNEWKARETA